MLRYAEARIKVCGIEAPISWDQEDDLPVYYYQGPSNHVARSPHRGELEPKDASTHESHLLDTTVLKE